MLGRLENDDDVRKLAPAGYYLALRVGFAFPLEEINQLPREWIEHYTLRRFLLHDPVVRWNFANTGAIRWSEITLADPLHVLDQARAFGLRYGVAVACYDGNSEGHRSFGLFARSDREFDQSEIQALYDYVNQLHLDKAPPTNLTNAELEALTMLRDGMRLKQIAFELGVSEGAVKQRLKNAKNKLKAQTSAQAAAKASDYGLI